MNLRQFVAIAAIINISGLPATAAGPYANIDAAVADVTVDSTLISRWVNDQMRDAAAFNATAGAVVPTQLKLLGFEVGVQGVATASNIDENSFRNLNTQLIDTHQFSLMSRLPLGNVLGHAKIGLPWGLDAGIRLGGIPSKSFNDGSSHYEISNTIAGIDLRKALIEEGITRPFGLTLGLGYTHAKGHITMSAPYHATSANVTVGGNTYTPSLDAQGTERTDWKTDSLGVQAILNKRIAFINPYVGASANHNWGTIESSINNVGSLILTDPNNVNPTLTQALDAGGGVSSKPNAWDIRALTGIEFSILPFTKLGLHAEIADRGRFGGSLGLRVQFH